MKHCVITGAAGGIGSALAARFGAAGYSLTGVDVDTVQVPEPGAQPPHRVSQLRWIRADLADSAGVAHVLQVLAEGPPIDCLIHCAGMNAVGRFAHMPVEPQRTVLDVNLLAPLLLTAGVLRRRLVAPGGSLVFVASLSHFVGYPGAAVYAASKDGLAAYARSLAVAYARRDMHVLTVYPGPTRTAHARRYSPDNRREQRRMPPEHLASAIYQALQGRRRVLIPGASNRLFAGIGFVLPGLTEWFMRRAILDRLRQ